MTEEPISEYDEGKIPEQKAKNILEAPEENEDYFPCPYKYIFKDNKNSKTDHIIDRETFDDLQKEVKHQEVLVKELKTQRELEEEIMQDSFVYNDEWDFFLEDLSGIMESKNGENDWETPCDASDDNCYIINKKNETGSRTLCVTTGKELLNKVINFDRFQYGTGPIRIFNYKKNGLKIIAYNHREEIYLLPACRSGFIRDWEHDGVCIEQLEEEE